MDEHDSLSPEKYEIRPTREPAVVQAVAVPLFVQSSAHEHLGGGVLPPDSRHISPTPRRYVVEHRAGQGLSHPDNIRHDANMVTTDDRAKERRWVVLAAAPKGQPPDGRYVTLGRESDPSDEEIRAAEETLRAQGMAGYLAIMEGNPWVGPMPRLMEVRALASPCRPFSEAAADCIEGIRRSREGARA
jgi:hypothetical protein